MREFLVIGIRCAKCGCTMEWATEKPGGIENFDDGISGGYKTTTNVYALPCRKCEEANQKPLRLLSEALRLAAANEKGKGGEINEQTQK